MGWFLPMLAGGVLSTASQLLQGSQQNKQSIRGVKYAYKKDLEQWNRQNAYNLPSAQMQRFKDAGLNPNMIYGQGNPGNATSYVKSGTPNLKSTFQDPLPTALGALGAYQNYQVNEARIDNVEQDTKLKATRTAVETVNESIKALDLQMKDYMRQPFSITTRGADGSFRVDKYSKGAWTVKRDADAYKGRTLEDLANAKSMLLRYNVDLARESANNALKKGTMMDAQTNAIKIKTQWETLGMGSGTPFLARMSYYDLIQKGVSPQIAHTSVLLAAGTTAIAKYLPKVGKSKSAPTYQSGKYRRSSDSDYGSFKSLQNRMDNY